MDFDSLFFAPKAGLFDVPRIVAFLEDLPFVGREPNKDDLFMVALSDEQLLRAQAKRKDDPSSSIWSVGLVMVKRERIEMALQVDQLARMRAIARWLVENFECRITNEYNRDLTSVANGNADNLFPADL